MTERAVMRGRLLVDGTLVDGGLAVEADRVVEVARGRAAALELGSGDQLIDADVIAPGFIDLQLNGAYGVDVSGDHGAGDHGAGDHGGIHVLSARLPATGVTAFLPTVLSGTPALYRRLGGALIGAGSSVWPGARPLGFHLEGPFLSPARAGAHLREAIEEADAAEAALFDLVATGTVRLVTLAPERPGALARIARLVAAGVTVSLGHTDATYGELIAGLDAGARMVTHLYNAMSTFHHRRPGAIGAALVDPRPVIGLIADGVHVHPAGLALALRARGARAIALVTDAMAAAGMAPGTYRLGGREVIVGPSSARLADGTLAGSIVTIDRAVRNMVGLAGADPADALAMASAVPAALLGLADRGVIAIGARADLVLLDADLCVLATYVDGRRVY